MSQPRKRVLFLIPSMICGGAQRVFSILLRRLDRNRFEPHLAVLEAGGAYWGEIPQDVVVHELGVSRVRYAAPAVVRLVRKVRPDAVLSTLLHVNLTLAAVKPLLPRNTRVLLRETVLTSAIFQPQADDPRTWRWLLRRLYRKADKVICLSRSMSDDLAEHFGVPRDMLVCIHNPLDVQRIRESVGGATNPFGGGGPHLVSVGRLALQKGHDVLLEAMPETLKHLPSATLTIIGGGPMAAELTARAQQLGLEHAVRFAGEQENPWKWVKHADLFVLPSRWEGMPNAVLEALALGTPVVATDCPGAMREVQREVPELVLVPPEDPAALARAMVAQCSGPGMPRRLENAEQRLSGFSVEKIVEEYSALF